MIVIEVRKSGIEGLGVFAARPFAADEVVREVEYEREVTREAPIDETRGEDQRYCSYLPDRVMLVAYPDRHMNHSCDPNCYYDYDEGDTKLRARRTICVGEEFTVDYLINNAGGSSWPCSCGSRRCRGETGVSFFTLPLEVQREYLPYLAHWFETAHKSKLSQL